VRLLFEVIEVAGAALGRNFTVTIGRAAWKACSATWNLGTNSAFPWSSESLPQSLFLPLSEQQSIALAKKTE
jgi:hypothetical protein